MLQRQVIGPAHRLQEQLPQRHRNGDFRHDVFFQGTEEVVAAGRIVQNRRGDLGKLPLHPADNFLDAANAHLGNRGAEPLPRLHQRGSLLELSLRQRARPQHHFPKAVLPVAALREDQLPSVEKQLPFHAPKHELQLAGQPGRVDSVKQREQRVVAFDLSRVQRLAIERKPTGRGDNRSRPLLRLKLLQKAVQPRPVVRPHVHELYAHALPRSSVPDDGARPHLAARHVENQFQAGSRGQRLSHGHEHTAHAEHVRSRDVSFPAALPTHHHSLGRLEPGMTPPLLP